MSQGRALAAPRTLGAVALLALALLLAGMPAARAAVITVTTFDDEHGTGGGCSLREAVVAANTDAAFGGCPAGGGADTVALGPGTYRISIPNTSGQEDASAEGDLDVTEDLIVSGAGAESTIVDGHWPANDETTDRIFHVLGSGVDLALHAMTVRDGRVAVETNTMIGSANSGGAVYVGGAANLVVTDSNLEDNFGGGYGGAVGMTESGSASISHTSISRNFAFEGGGIASDGLLALDHVVVGGFPPAGEPALRNEAFVGGGIYAGGQTTIRHSSIVDNISLGGIGTGGGIFNYGVLDVSDSTIALNESFFSVGGGIYNEGSGTLTNVTVSGNRAWVHGGGIYESQVVNTLNLTNVTVARNVADVDQNGDGDGGGIYISESQPPPPRERAASAEVPANLKNTIIGDNRDSSPGSNNVEADCSGPVTSQGNNLVEDPTGCTGLGGSDITGVDPMLEVLGDYGGPTHTHALLRGSRAIDAASGGPAADQRGVPRPFGAAPDIGAYEFFLCLNVPVNAVGTQGADMIDVRGDPPRDSVLALGGDDRILVGPGPDVVCAGGGNDLVKAGSGRDRVLGQAGADLIRGAGSPDVLRGGPGPDLLFGGGTLRGKGDTCNGGPGRDVGRGCEREQNIP